MSGGRACTTSELSASLPDVSKATLYRHVALLLEGGLVEVASENRVRGAVERRYRVHRARTKIDKEAAASMSLEDHRRGFAAAVTALLADFDAYLDRKHSSPAADLVGYTQVPLWLTRDELVDLINGLRMTMGSKMDNLPGPGRRLYMLSPILFPITEGEDSSGPQESSREDTEERH
jgi:DNA-binding transcriptional ArsR family regulator